MKDLTKEDLKKIIDVGNVIEIYDDIMNYTFTFYYIYSGDSCEAVFLNNRFYGYFDLDEYIDKIKTRKDEKKYLTKLIKEEMKGYLIQRIDTFKEILSKHKEITGQQCGQVDNQVYGQV